MDKNIGWELYRSFLGVLKEGSLSGAARALGITQPTVGRHVAALEEALGVVLFTRSPGGLMPTELAFSMSLETWVTMHEDLRNSPRCRATFDALVQGLHQHVG